MYIPSNQLDEKIYCYDVNSLYPSVMINKLRARASARQARDLPKPPWKPSSRSSRVVKALLCGPGASNEADESAFR